MSRIKIPDIFQPLFKPKRYKVLSGGRGSGKTETVARYLLIASMQSKERILCTRELQASISDSVYKTLKDIVELYDMPYFDITQTSIKNVLTGSEFIFKGLRHNINEIKSTKGITKVWCEESQSLSKASLDILLPTIREEGSELIFTFNRLNDLDPVYEMFCLNKNDDVWYLHTTFEDNPFFPEVLDKERLRCLEERPEDYPHIWLGEPISQSDKAILSRIAINDAMNRQVDSEGAYQIGADIGRFGSDISAIYKRKGLKIIDSRFLDRKDNVVVANEIKELAGRDKKMLIKVDATGVGGGVCDILRADGYNVVDINFGASPKDKDKYNNLISEAWFHFKEIINEVEIPNDDELKNELATREWKVDNKGRRCVESKDDYKKRGYKSPNKADAILITFYDPDDVCPQIVDIGVGWKKSIKNI